MQHHHRLFVGSFIMTVASSEWEEDVSPGSPALGAVVWLVPTAFHRFCSNRPDRFVCKEVGCMLPIGCEWLEMMMGFRQRLETKVSGFLIWLGSIFQGKGIP